MKTSKMIAKRYSCRIKGHEKASKTAESVSGTLINKRKNMLFIRYL